jgi:predicted outer membrane repeat protein
MRPSQLALTLCASLLAASLHAATFTVDSDRDLVDAIPGDGACDVGVAVSPGEPRCTLRAAVMEAEANGEPDTILITPGLVIELDLAGNGGAEIGDLDITTDISILGYSGEVPPFNAALLPRIDASAMNDRHFEVANGRLRLRGLRLHGGWSGFVAGSILAFGTGAPTLELEHVVFSDNSAGTFGGAIVAAQSATLVVSDSHFLGNETRGVNSLGAGAAIHLLMSATGIVRRSSFVDNREDTTDLSTMFRATIRLDDSSQLRLENSTLDGTAVLPPTPGLEARQGIVVRDAANLIVRNTTITGYPESAIYFDAPGAESVVRIAHSILASDGSACVVQGGDPGAADVQIAYSMVQSQSGCSSFYGPGVRSLPPGLAALDFDGPPRLTVSRRPTGPLSNVVDAGLDIELTPSDPEFACIDEDQRRDPRVRDADLDERFLCDFGAIEQPPPVPFVVDHFADDLTDAAPGDGSCATASTPGIGVVCTLRAAVMEANALPGLQQIMFAPSTGPAVLDLPGSIPDGGTLEITETLAIDGNSIDGRPATTIEGRMTDAGLFQIDASDVYLRDLQLTGGDAAADGGAIELLSGSELFLRRSEVFGNRANRFGGAVATIGGRIQISDSDFHQNSSGEGALAIDAGPGSSIDLNRSSLRAHLGNDGNGMALPTIHIEGGQLFLTNTTFSGNQQGILADQPGTVLMRHTTLLDHLDGGLQVNLDPASQIFLVNNIVAAPGGATAPDCVFTNTVGITFFDIDSILDSDGSCAAAADRNGLTADPILLPLARPPGRISYQHAPSVAATDPSPAIDVGTVSGCTVAADQSGRPRPVDLVEIDNLSGPCDLGAIEAQVFDQLFDDSFELLF